MCYMKKFPDEKLSGFFFLLTKEGLVTIGSIFSADFFIIPRKKNAFIEKKTLTQVLNKGLLICPLWKLKVLSRETKQNEMVIIPTQFRLDFFVSTFLPALFFASLLRMGWTWFLVWDGRQKSKKRDSNNLWMIN